MTVFFKFKTLYRATYSSFTYCYVEIITVIHNDIPPRLDHGTST